MSVNLVKFEKKHIDSFSLQPLQLCDFNLFKSDECVRFYEEYFYTLIKGERVLGFGGIIPETHDVGLASVYLTGALNNDMIHVHRATLNFIKNSNMRRIFMRCHVDFKASIIWANLLGFQFEGIEKEYVKGADFARFALIKEGK